MKQIVQNFAQNLNNSTVPSSGLDFDGNNSGIKSPSDGLDFISADSASKPKQLVATATPQPKPALEFGDPMVVDARNVPSGLPKSVDDAIAAGFAGAPPGVSDRVRKGFQAVAAHDWKVAKAWFEDALNHDPDNAGLKRLVALADYTGKRNEQKTTSTSKVSDKPLTNEEIPADADERTYALTSTKIHTLEAWGRFIDKKHPKIDPSKLPKDSDILFLFPNESPQTGQLQLPTDADMKFLSTLPPDGPPNDAAGSKNPYNPYEIK